MSANKIDRSLLGDPRVLARFQQSRATAPNDERGAKIEGKAVDGQAAVPTGEKLEISASARKLAQLRDLIQAGRAKLAEETPERTEKLATVRQRLQSGVYTSVEIRNQVAGKLTGLMRGLDTLLE
ncbi:flagellar biosynthesis anti-sigma factor FlgM [bacterium]|nr:flagellar biosynthesis anti-sigma factor FlgM [bacterium]MBU1073772.1 flagellar biosynthesis anti-sigma factor FlgM [bacterium]MBU1674899.1 flagellar biosynthesis anti-sigma factor FlgM [bacterium]